jgi:hypothetical protein
MSEQNWRVQQLEKEVEELKDEVRDLRSLRDNLIGISTAARWGIKILIALGGYGALNLVSRIIQWLNAPMKPH